MHSTLSHLLLALVVILSAAKAMGLVLRLLRQPPVIGELLAGIMLGPSMLGLVAPEAQAFLFPPSLFPALEAIAQLGVLLFLFVVGLGVDLEELRRESRTALVISQAGLLVPFALGCALALLLYEDFAPAGTALVPFAGFIGVAMAITAFPVLARILADQGIAKTPLGRLTLACAAVADATAWCGLAVVMSLAGRSFGGAATTLALTAAFGAFMLLVARRAVEWYCARIEGRALDAFALALFVVGVLVCGLATDAIGIHALFGAFLFGVIIPHRSRAASELASSLERFTGVLLLPVFFAYSGLRTRFDLLVAPEAWGFALLVIAVATLGKWGAVTAAARARGLSFTDASAMGVLMNCRGLMELVVLNIGLDAGILDARVFALFALMAIVTTAMTSPLFAWITRKKPWGLP